MTTVHPDAGIIWFPGLGFRPAVWTPPHRADGVDPDRLIVAPDADTAFIAKYTGPTIDPYAHVPDSGYSWGTWLPADAPQITAASLAGPAPQPVTPWQPLTPWWPPFWPDGPDSPCCIVQEPDTPLPPIAPVPLPASGILLACAVGLFLVRRRK
ncbi:MAG: hypothetical protein FJX25_16210 [Alphaproteobacteria bacterium]|nr:hypothetical protein [Alphaproteobacteria bacterium]